MQHRVAANSITIAFILDLNQLLSHASMHACPDDLGGVFRGRSGNFSAAGRSAHAQTIGGGGFPAFVVRHCWHKSAQITTK